MRRQDKSYRKAFPILASESVQFIEAGATIDAAMFPIGYIPAGYCVAQSVVTGKWEPYQDDGEYVDYGVTVIGFDNDGANDTIFGELIVRGSVFRRQVKNYSVPFALKAPMIRFVEEGVRYYY